MYKVLCAVFLLALWGCGPVKNLEKSKTIPPGNAVADTSSAVFRATVTKRWKLVHTGIDIRFNLPEKTAEATTTIRLHPYFYPTDSVVLDAKDMKILEVSDQNNQALNYQYDSAHLKIRLPELYQKEDTLLLTIKYIAMPYLSRPGGSSAIMEDRGLYFINTDHAEPYKPVQIWTQGETESNSHWFPTFDAPDFRSSFDITMHVPDSFTTLSNGILVKTVEEQNGLKAVSWHQALPIPPYLVMMAAGNFYEAKDHWNGKEVNYYVPQLYAPYAKDIFKYTPEMIAYFSQVLDVPFPWDKYSQVVVYDYVSGAMENVSAGLFGAFNLKDDRELKDDPNDFIIAHELFHQWFGDYVTCESWGQITLNESFADFSQKLWLEHQYGNDEAQIDQITSLNQYLKQAETSDPPLVRFHYDTEMDVFDRVSYSKGGLILSYLRHITGDKAFFAALHLYLTKNALHSAEASQLRLSFEQTTGEDWHWFFNEWYYRGGHPELSVSYQYDDQKKEVTATVSQEQNGPVYRLPLKAAVIRNGQVKKVDWLITDRQQSFVYAYEGKDRPVIIPDAGHWLPGEIKDHKAAWQWLEQLRYSDDLMGKYFAVLAASNPKMVADSAAMIWAAALKDNKAYVRETAVEALDLTTPKYKKQFGPVLGNLAQNDPDNGVRSAALYRLAAVKAPAYISTYEMAAFDSSYYVASAGLTALDALNHARALDDVRSLLLINSRSALWLTTAGKIIGEEGKADDYSFYENTILHLFERRREMFMQAFVVYLNHVTSESLYRDGITLIQKVADRDASSNATFALSRSLFQLYRNADKKARITSDKMQMAALEKRRDMALKAWETYKQSVKDEKILKMIAQLENNQFTRS